MQEKREGRPKQVWVLGEENYNFLVPKKEA